RGSRVYAQVVPDLGEDTVLPEVHTRVLPASTVYTDEWGGYEHLGVTNRRYRHSHVRHSQKVYVDGDVHTNTIEGFWSLLKRGVSGVYHGVSTKHLQSYLDEYVFRYNNREDPRGMFSAFLNRIEKASPETAF
ncbi:MAG: IS1595 family transposase, partial [Actinomycetota bacterium]|nr:IS1595 family transposase [Actinomycetota bacterium]